MARFISVCIITLGIGLLSRYMTRGQAKTSQLDAIVALLSLLMLIVDVVLYGWVVSGQFEQGYGWLSWFLPVAATACSLVFKIAAADEKGGS
jgi:hypothetical protein